MSKIFRILVIIVVLGLIGWFAVAFLKSCNQSSGVELPPIDKAQYQVTIKNTGYTVFSNSVDTAKVAPDKNFYTLHGYWEYNKGKFTFKNVDLPLDERIFGPIEVKKR